MDYFRGKRFLDTLPDWERGRPATGPLEDYLPRVRRLLQRLGDPQRDTRSIIVGGTNGKGTVATLLADLVRASGLRCGLYTSPHLHSQRERIRIDGQLLSKDDWADALTRFYDASRGFAAESLGEFSRFEALTVLAADLFCRQKVDIAIYEVGLGGRFDSTNAWDHEISVLSRIGLDHCDILGDELTQIADEKLPIARGGRPLYTTGRQDPDVLAHIRRHCADTDIPLHVADRDEIITPEGSIPYTAPVGAHQERPGTFVENAHLALAVAQRVLPDLAPELVEGVIERFAHAGRFEVARRDPYVILDGAHNPPAAQALVEDLRQLDDAWHFVVAMNRGHDVAGLLTALAPLAASFILTESEHPKAQGADALAAAVPADVPIQVIPNWQQALRAAGEGGNVCVTGSLYLIARAREHLHLPYEA
ncbi:MAG: hypothetical protein HOH74_16595, partial [Gemmatimonadetes bacterium]|nr:hypothetical protein [Gemmatimonadota bacterium]